MSALAVIFFVGLAVYILYLRVQLYVNQRILNAFQNAAIVVPHLAPPPSRAGLRLVLFILGLLILAWGAWPVLVR